MYTANKSCLPPASKLIYV